MYKPYWATVLLLIVTACSAASERQATPDLPIVRIAKVETAASAQMVETAGTVALREETILAFTSPGRVSRVLVNEGDKVRRGQLLAVLDTTPVSATLAIAVAEQTRARAELRRLEPLMDKGWITRPRYEAAVAAAQSADAAVEARRFSLETARIVAASDGVIMARLAEPGQVVAEGMPVLVLGKANSGYVLRAPLSDRELVRVRQGASARIILEALEGEPLAGAVLEIGGRADRATGTFQVEISLPADPRLRSGLIGRASIAAGPTLDAAPGLLVPPLAIFGARAGEGFVYLLGNDNRVRLRKIRIGQAGDRGVEVLEGLAPGDRVAISTLDQLQDGMAIRPESSAR